MEQGGWRVWKRGLQESCGDERNMNWRGIATITTLGMSAVVALAVIWVLSSGTRPVAAMSGDLRPPWKPGDASKTVQGSGILTSVAHLRRWNNSVRTGPIRGSDTLTPAAYLPLVMAHWPPISIVEHDRHWGVYWYRPGSTWIEAYSEVRNNGQQNVRGVDVIFNIYDTDGVLIATDTSYSMIDVIRPGQSSPVVFRLDVPGGHETIQSSKVKLTVRNTWSYTSIDTQDSFELISHSSFEDSNGARHVVGEVENIGGVAAYLQATVWIRGRGEFQDMIIAAGNDWVWDVAPGERVPFEEVFWKNFGDSYDHYEIVLEGS